MRFRGYYHGDGVWVENAELLLQQNPYASYKTIAHRDDVMNALMRYGVERAEAFRIMRIVQSPKKLTEEDLQWLREKGISEEYIESMIKIRYLFPKAHDTEYAIKYFKLIWYKVHFPEEFEAAVNKNVEK